MIMKTRVLCVITMLCSIICNTSAQNFHYGPTVEGSLNISKNSKTLMGAAVGAKGEVSFKEDGSGWFVGASLLLNNRNSRSDNYYYSTTQQTCCWKYSTMSLMLPIDAGYRFRLTEKVKLMPSVGPYIECGLLGTDKCRITENNGTTHETKMSSNVYKDGIYNRMNFGLNARLGVEFAKHYQINLVYSRGLTKIYKDSHNDRSQDIRLGFTYLF